VNWFDPTDEQIAGYAAWVASRPPEIRPLAEKFLPWVLYRMKSTGHRVTVYAIEEQKDGSAPTLKVDVDGRFNLVAMSRRVFGIYPEDLEECDLPSPDEPVGDMHVPIEEIHAAMKKRRTPP
jgi:hypothetical protein